MNSLLLRKMAITFVVAFAAVFLPAALGIIDAVEARDWASIEALSWSAFIAAIAAGLRALVALLFAFVPTDGADGVNLAGKYAPPAE
jgi:hypothetical protein